MLKRLSLAVAFMAAMLLTPIAAAADTHDGWVDGTEGSFTRGVHSHWFYVFGIDDTDTDGHCVYFKIVKDGRRQSDLKSCGSYKTREYERSNHDKLENWRCVTGHWDCDSRRIDWGL